MPISRRSRLISIAAAIAVTVGAAPMAANAAVDHSAIEQSSQYTGEGLLRAVVFGDMSQAPVLEGVIPSVEQTPEAQAVIDDLIRIIDEDDPAFFDSFAGELQSGDVLQVQAGLDDARFALADALVDGGYATQEDMITPQWAALAAFVFAAVAVVVGGVAVLTVQAVATNSVYATNTQVQNASGRSTSGELAQERLIADVTQALS